jgi:hypothetical protein
VFCSVLFLVLIVVLQTLRPTVVVLVFFAEFTPKAFSALIGVSICIPETVPKATLI